MSDPWIDAPLSVAIQTYVETCEGITSHSKWTQIDANLEYGNHSSRKFTQQSCFSRWNVVCLVCVEKAHRNTFLQTLSAVQSHSLRVLFEWLEDGICQDPDTIAASLAFLAVDSQRLLPEDFMQQEMRTVFASNYQKALRNLWNAELTMWARPTGRSIYPYDLPNTRSRVSVAAYVQRLGASVYGERLLAVKTRAEAASRRGNSGSDSAHSNPESAENPTTTVNRLREMVSCPSHATIEEPGLRGPLVLEKARCLIDTKWLAELGEERLVAQCMSVLRFPSESPELYSYAWELEVVVDFCPWLTGAEKAGSPPYYLWDVERGRTVYTSDFRCKLEYVAVSHTWGRWLKRDHPSIEVPGALWPVPQNTRFDVSHLPYELGIIGRRLDCQYVWFDLVCIPQVDDECPDYNWGDIKQREIGRQATIFSSAKHAVAWLNDISDFRGIKEAAHWKAIHLLESPVASTEYDRALRIASWMNASRFLPKFWDNLSTPSIENVNGWLSSLWTLQEVCLRPDMYLCTQNWDFLSFDDNTPLRMDRLVALFSSERPSGAPDLHQPSQQDPQIEKSITLALSVSGLMELCNHSPLSILFQGDRRYCKRKRADAIMSVIGAVSWKRDKDDKENELVLGKYPLDFVTEVREKLGALFFAMRCWDGLAPKRSIIWSGHMGNMLANIADRLSELWLGFRQAKPAACGSLMPFGYSDVVNRLPVDFENANLRGHSSVETWKVHGDGSTTIQDAVVLSSPSLVQSQSICGIDVNLVWGHEAFNGDLHRWIRDQWSPHFAILLFCEEIEHLSREPRGYRWVSGIVVKRVAGVYHVCVGSFQSTLQATDEYSISSVQQLNWVIL